MPIPGSPPPESHADPTLLLRDLLARPTIPLRFPSNLEQQYQEEHQERYRTHIYLTFWLGLLAVLSNGALDYYWMPDVATKMWQLRLLVALPLPLLLLLSKLPDFKHKLQSLLVIAGTIITFGIIALGRYAVDPFPHYYNCSIILILLAMFMLARITFRWGLVLALMMAVAMNLALIVVARHTWTLVLVSNFVFATSAIASLIGAFLIERSSRQNWLQARLLALDTNTLEEANLRLEYLTAIDSLTQVANRRTLDRNLEAEWARAQRKQEPISLIMIDVDHFKPYNDTYGHLAGDDCLRAIAAVLRDFARRPGDLAARYGGEEFVLVLSGLDAAQASTMAEGVRQRIEGLGLKHAGSPLDRVTASLGIATLVPIAATTPALLVEMADQALYQAKRSGRNRVLHQASLAGKGATAHVV